MCVNFFFFFHSISSNKDVVSDMTNWGLKFSNDVIQLQGRVVPAEIIVMRDKKQVRFHNFVISEK